MSSSDPASNPARPVGLPRVAAILVVRNGAEWLPSVLATLAAQRYPALDLVVVDNASTDDSADILGRRIPADRLVTLPRNAGYTRAVASALTHPVVDEADLVLLLHDDLAPAPDAIARLVHAMREDPAIAVVGPKLRDWSEEPVLQEVGMTVDRFGRAESQLEPAELDQGQHDRQRPVLYVSTAGMLVRRDVLAELGGFDLRFPLFRDDLDLCWRAWLAGYRVEVVPSAVAYHVAAATRGARELAGRAAQGRYLAERHALATVLKNYGARRLLWVLPVVILLAVVKTLTFLATRRFADAAAVVRAHLWNAAHLPTTLQRRKVVQRRRRVADRDLGRLFAPGLPRARTSVEALGSWLAGGSTRVLLEDPEQAGGAQAEPGGAFVRAIRNHPAASAGLALLAVYLLGLRALLGGGQLVGVEIAAWPETARTFLRAYASPWNGEPVGSAAFASPVQAVLGIVSLLGFGNAWLAQRLVVFGLLPVAWLLAVRAGRLMTARPGPRLLGATLYVLSPAVLGALGQGRLGTLVAAALLPGIVLLAVRAADARTPLGTAWRSSALLALATAVLVAAEPGIAPVLVLGYLGLLFVALRNEARQPAVRLGVAGGAALLLLGPWLVGLVLGGTVGVRTGAPLETLPLWRALAAAPEVLPAFAGTAGIRSALTAAAVVAVAVLLGLRTRPTAVAGLVAAVAASALLAWGATRLGARWVWTPALLLPAALAIGGLGVIAARTLAGGLRSYAFGTRQLAVVVAVVALGAGLAGGVLRLAGGPWEGLRRDPQLVPEFVAADQPRVGPYRILLLAVDDGTVTWELVTARGPSMVDYGTRADEDLITLVDDSVGGAVGGADLRAGTRLGLANVRYVVVSEATPSDALIAALGRQPALEPLPSGGGRVFQVVSWLPRAVVLPPGPGEALLAAGDPGAAAGFEETGLDRPRRDLYVGREPVAEGGVLVVSEGSSPLWHAFADGRRLEPREVEGINAFAVPPGSGPVRARVGGGVGHRTIVAMQALLLLGVVSLALRPPGFTQARAESVARGLPSDLAGGVAPAAVPARDDTQGVRG
ncbi:MAG TPA: glycosyltransferase [Egibacteraceae bacterium]|nr:glycosyltransferase [Egibacteraceae bacterium]